MRVRDLSVLEKERGRESEGGKGGGDEITVVE